VPAAQIKAPAPFGRLAVPLAWSVSLNGPSVAICLRLTCRVARLCDEGGVQKVS
jgi:hypothetical protein